MISPQEQMHRGLQGAFKITVDNPRARLALFLFCKCIECSGENDPLADFVAL